MYVCVCKSVCVYVYTLGKFGKFCKFGKFVEIREMHEIREIRDIAGNYFKANLYGLTALSISVARSDRPTTWPAQMTLKQTFTV